MCCALIRQLTSNKHVLLIGTFFGLARFLRFCQGGILLTNDEMLSLSSHCLLRLLLIIVHIDFMITLLTHDRDHYDHVNDVNDHANDDDVNDLNDNLL